MWDTRSSYVGNHDGDTVTYLSDMGRRIFHQADHRLLGVWAPELSEPGGMDVRDFVAEWHQIRIAKKKWPFLVTTTLVRASDVDTAEAKKTLDRYVSTVTCIATNESLNVMVQQYIERMGYSGGIGS